MKSVVITGAAGRLGSLLVRHLEGRFDLRLLDIAPRGDPRILAADLSRWDNAWIDSLRGCEVIVHLAADPTAQQTWPNLIAPNVDAVVLLYLAAVEAGVRRVVFASSNHVMGGYSDDSTRLTAETPPRPGMRYVVQGETRDSTPYASAKLFGERMGKCFADAHGLEVIAVRIGWAGRPVPPERDRWWHQMHLSDRDFCRLMERCVVADLPEKFVVINGMSRNDGMRWDIDSARRLVGYEPE